MEPRKCRSLWIKLRIALDARLGPILTSIWGPIWGQVGVNLGSSWGSKSDSSLRPLFNTFLTPFRTPLGPQVGPKLEALGRLGAILGPFICDDISNTFSNPILDRFWTPKRPQNRSKIDEKSMPKLRSEKGLISASLSFNFEENVMLMPNRPIFNKHAKTQCFCVFFEYPLGSRNEENNLATV